MRIAIMGAGGQGGYYGGMLARAGEDVTFIARGAHLDSIKANGLTVKTPHAGEFTIDAKATDDPTEIGPVDLVMFCVKTCDTEAATVHQTRRRHRCWPAVSRAQRLRSGPDQRPER